MHQTTLAIVIALLVAAAPTVAERIPLVPGPDTTVFEGPLRDDGTVDYIAALNGVMGEGVAAEDNAFAGLWRVRAEARFTDRDAEVASLLGVDDDADAERFLSFHDFMDEPGWAMHEDDVWAIYDVAYVGPFVGDDVPDVMAWLERVGPALDRIAESTRRPDWFVPLTADEDGTGNIAAVIPYMAMHRELARAFMFRIHMAAGEGRHEDAVADLLAMRRLAAHLRQDTTMISHFIGRSIDAMAVGVLQGVLSHNAMPAEQLARLSHGWSPAIAQRTTAEAIDLTERLYVLDLLQQGWSGRMDMEDYAMAASLLGDDAAEQLLGAFTIMLDERFDINASMRMTHRAFDELVKVVSADAYADYYEQAEAYEAAVEDALTEADLRLLSAAAEGKPPEDADGRALTGAATRAVLRHLTPALTAGAKPAFRAVMQGRLVAVGLALERYRLEADRYPQTLDALVPQYLVSVPTDLFDGEPVRYRPGPDPAQYVLYSVGSNRLDEGGDEDGGHDIVFRVGPGE